MTFELPRRRAFVPGSENEALQIAWGETPWCVFLFEREIQ
jgi:hypothetical protein